MTLLKQKLLLVKKLQKMKKPHTAKDVLMAIAKIVMTVEAEKAIEKIMAHTHNGEIMLLHPTSATNAQIMDELLTRLENEGYRTGSLEEIFD